MSSPFPTEHQLTINEAFSSSATLSQASETPGDLVPMSFRVTEDERAQIRKDAGKQSVSAYIRQTLVGDKVSARSPRYTKKQRQPGIDHKALAQLVGLLGQSELATSLMALALAAQSGDVVVSPEAEAKLHTACEQVDEIRILLISALNLKVEDAA